MNDKKLMQTTLDALEKISMGGHPDWADDVIPLLRTRLAQPELQREWQGLTDEEKKDILDCGRPNLVNIKKAEQKLKEKNT